MDTAIRYLGKCAACKEPAAINYTKRGEEYFRPDGKRVAPHGLGVYWCRCGKLARLQEMKGTFNPEKRCDARCRNAKRAECECACGGMNHGAGYNLITFEDPAPPAPPVRPIARPTTMPSPIQEPQAPRVAIPSAPAATVAIQEGEPTVRKTAPPPNQAALYGPAIAGSMSLGFNPSPYQASIFGWVQEGRGDAFVDAVAGSGKTTTLKAIATMLRSDSALFCAFNKHIADELGQKLPSSVTVKTIHSIGLGILFRFLGAKQIKGKIEDTKYSTIVREYVRAIWGDAYGREEQNDIVDGLRDVVQYSQNSLTDTEDWGAVQAMMAHFGIRVEHINPEAVHTAMKRILAEGLRQFTEEGIIGFVDMVWMPQRLNLRAVKQFDWVLVDEAQDLSPAQLEIVLKCRRAGGRIVFVGDKRQAIYGFAGADAYSIENIKLRTGAKEMPLSICYRCPTSHLDLAREIVPQIEARPGASAGVVEWIKEEHLPGRIQEGDLILCRVTAPLIALCFDLIGRGIPARVKGRDIGKGLISMLTKAAKMLFWKWSDVVTSLDTYQIMQVRALQEGGQAEKNAMAISKVEDQVASLLAIYRRSMPRDLNTFTAAIEDIFSDGRPSVMLSTVHRAKGLEERRVFILCPELMPHPRAYKDWEIEQEWNLKYVALTRSMGSLFFVESKPKKDED